MKPGTITHTIAALLSSVSSLFAHSTPDKAEPAKVKLSKKSDKLSEDLMMNLDSIAFTPRHLSSPPPKAGERYPWKRQIVTTVFWIGEAPSGNNPVPNRSSSWDKDWARSYGGFDDTSPAHRSEYLPVKFTPRQNPFYCALPYNDKASAGHRPEATRVIPWFQEAYQGSGVSVCKGRWVAISNGNRTAYAQWEDAGPFRTDHGHTMFDNECLMHHLKKGARIDVFRSVGDYVRLKLTDVTHWRF